MIVSKKFRVVFAAGREKPAIVQPKVPYLMEGWRSHAMCESIKNDTEWVRAGAGARPGSGLIFEKAHAILGQAMGAPAFQAHLDQGVGVVDGCVGIGDDAVATDKGIHVIFPGFVVAAAKHFYFLTFT